MIVNNPFRIQSIIKMKKMQETGPQYLKDNSTDPTGFLRKARLHQSRFRALTLNLPYDTYGNYLTESDGKAGKNFYDGFDVFKAVEKRYPKYSKPLYSNMLRSEHIPFNLFVPFCKDKEYCKKVLNDFLYGVIQNIDIIIIEHAPKPKKDYLNDATSFDAYIEYTHSDNSRGMIGIEVKYTEKDYKLIDKSKQAKDINNLQSDYYRVTKECKIYKQNAISVLPTDEYRQIWRNHILGESILLVKPDEYKHFTSLTIFPEGNKHFVETSKKYIDLLVDNDNKFVTLTYESFLESCNKHCPNKSYEHWISYLTKRYIVTEDEVFQTQQNGRDN